MNEALIRIKGNIERSLYGARVARDNSASILLPKLIIRRQGATVKIEANPVFRGSVWPPQRQKLCKKAEDLFEMSIHFPILSEADLIWKFLRGTESATSSRFI